MLKCCARTPRKNQRFSRNTSRITSTAAKRIVRAPQFHSANVARDETRTIVAYVEHHTRAPREQPEIAPSNHLPVLSLSPRGEKGRG